MANSDNPVAASEGVVDAGQGNGPFRILPHPLAEPLSQLIRLLLNGDGLDQRCGASIPATVPARQRPLPGPLAQIRPRRTARRRLTPRMTKCVAVGLAPGSWGNTTDLSRAGSGEAVTRGFARMRARRHGRNGHYATMPGPWDRGAGAPDLQAGLRNRAYGLVPRQRPGAWGITDTLNGTRRPPSLLRPSVDFARRIEDANTSIMPPGRPC
jgi:hypothetical protein